MNFHKTPDPGAGPHPAGPAAQTNPPRHLDPRHGITTLFAALNLAHGKVSGQCLPRQRHIELLKFLRQIDARIRRGRRVAPHHRQPRRPQARAGAPLAGAPPPLQTALHRASSGWLNQVERWFAELTGKAVRRGSFSSVPDLIDAITHFIKQWNQHPKPFAWTAKAGGILAKIERCRRRLESIQPGCTRRKPQKKSLPDICIVILATLH